MIPWNNLDTFWSAPENHKILRNASGATWKSPETLLKSPDAPLRPKESRWNTPEISWYLLKLAEIPMRPLEAPQRPHGTPMERFWNSNEGLWKPAETALRWRNSYSLECPCNLPLLSHMPRSKIPYPHGRWQRSLSVAWESDGRPNTYRDYSSEPGGPTSATTYRQSAAAEVALRTHLSNFHFVEHFKI